MQIIISQDEKRFGLALACALALHLSLLALHVSAPSKLPKGPPGGPMTVNMAKPRKTPHAAMALPRQKAAKPQQAAKTKQKRLPPEPRPLLSRGPSPVSVPLRPPAAADEKQTWSRAEKDEIDDFLKPAPSKPMTGGDLAQRAMAAARNLPPVDDSNPQERMELQAQNRRLAKADPFTLEMYFDALYRKLNRTAAFVKRPNHDVGRNSAAVRITLNPDGTLKSFRVMWSADQQAEIAYVNDLFKRAAPFSPFPPELLRATDSLILEICIVPGQGGGSDGAVFTPMASGSSCR